jgi:hypothetical protein
MIILNQVFIAGNYLSDSMIVTLVYKLTTKLLLTKLNYLIKFGKYLILLGNKNNYH